MKTLDTFTSEMRFRIHAFLKYTQFVDEYLTTYNIVTTGFQIFWTPLQKHLRNYNSYINNLDDFLTAIYTLATRHLSHKIADLDVLISYLQVTKTDIKKQDPQYDIFI